MKTVVSKSKLMSARQCLRRLHLEILRPELKVISPSTEAAFENNPGRVIAALKSAMQHGLRDPQFFGDPIFGDWWDEPRFVALEQELDASLAAEHDKVLQLICFNNPAPAGWQPKPETCEGVEEQLIL